MKDAEINFPVKLRFLRAVKYNGFTVQYIHRTLFSSNSID